MKDFSRALPLLFLACTSAETQAAGFYLQEQSVPMQGAAFAGAAAHATDASTIFFNPAGLTSLDGAQTTAGGNIIMPRAKMRDAGSAAGLAAGVQAPVARTDAGGNPFSPEFAPNLYAAAPAGSGGVWIGIGVSAPFGLANEYEPGWFGRYDSTKSALKVIDIAPVVAARVTERLSIGGGPNFHYAKAVLESAVPCPTPALGCGAAFDPASDGLQRLEGENWDIGFNFGATWDMNDATRLGIHYRSAISNDMPGLITVSGLGGALAANNGARTGTAKLKLPDILGLGIRYQAGEKLILLGSYNHIGWDNYDAIPVVFDNGDPASITPQNYKDSYSAALGAEWRHSEALSFRGGIQFDKTPTTDADRSSRTPDSDRYWISAGASYRLGPGISIDVAATHIFMEDGDISVDRTFYAGTAFESETRIRANADNALDILSLQAVWRF